jgi:hypothetical protein
MQPKNMLPYLQEPATGHYAKPVVSTPTPNIQFNVVLSSTPRVS